MYTKRQRQMEKFTFFIQDNTLSNFQNACAGLSIDIVKISPTDTTGYVSVSVFCFPVNLFYLGRKYQIELFKS